MIQQINIENFNTYTNNKFIIRSDKDFLELQSYLKPVKKISWIFENKETLIEVKDSITFYPFFSLNKIIVLFSNQPEFPHPNNLVVYNGNGTVHKIISVPILIHSQVLNMVDLWIKNHPKEKTSIKDFVGTFSLLSNIQEIEGTNYLIVFIKESTIYTSRPNLEKRFLDVQTWQWDCKWSDYYNMSDPKSI